MQTKEKMGAALQCYVLGIREMLSRPKFPCEESIANLADQYAADVADRETMEAVSEWFDWDKIVSFLEAESD